MQRTLATRSRLMVLALVLVTPLGSGCGSGERSASGSITRSDSSGVSLLVLEGQVDSLPRIGPTDTLTLRGAPEDLFARNPQVAFPLRDGRTLLSDGSLLAVFDTNGVFDRVAIPEGRGPGEIAALAGFWQTADDSLWLVDIGTRRLSRFDPTLAYARSIQYPSGGSLGGVALWHEMGRDTVAAMGFSSDASTSSPGRRITSIRAGYWVLGPDSAVLGEERPFGENVTLPPGAWVEPSISAPFQRSAVFKPLGRCSVFGFSDRWELRVEEPAPVGKLRLVATVRAPANAPPSIGPDEREAYIDGSTRGFRNPDLRAQLQRAIREHAPFPSTEPHFGRVLTSRDGAIWVQRYRGPGTAREDVWTVVDAGGARAWQVRVPPRSRLLAVDSARAFVATADDDDVETQHWWRFRELADVSLPAACRP